MSEPSICTHKEEAMWSHSEKVAIYKPGREQSPETKFATATWLRTSSLQKWEKINVCCLSQLACSILLWQPTLTDKLMNELIYIKILDIDINDSSFIANYSMSSIEKDTMNPLLLWKIEFGQSCQITWQKKGLGTNTLQEFKGEW